MSSLTPGGGHVSRYVNHPTNEMTARTSAAAIAEAEKQDRVVYRLRVHPHDVMIDCPSGEFTLWGYPVVLDPSVLPAHPVADCLVEVQA